MTRGDLANSYGSIPSIAAGKQDRAKGHFFRLADGRDREWKLVVDWQNAAAQKPAKADFNVGGTFGPDSRFANVVVGPKATPIF